ncbi:hypothetical protein SM0020_18392 [Sinorhizobium meliloti CCNWSX0020]|uniref:Uncharacterized protein n=1 Tax=Sinorhizobium meliloti CCNWSX0020 TaxID=1107881 RepID=H0G2I8_RHIML|nr:hypothetical protein SM0020_18392 [Sinorhizobium meliloti CCNWSX0020]
MIDHAPLERRRATAAATTLYPLYDRDGRASIDDVRSCVEGPIAGITLDSGASAI